MTRIKIKRAYENRNRTTVSGCSSTGCGPAECGKEDFRYDLWAKQIALRPLCEGGITKICRGVGEEFGRRYAAELRQSPAVAEFVRQIAGNDTVTLVYASGTLCRIMP